MRVQQAAAPDVAAVQAQVAASVRSVLGGDISPDAPLMESGLDSLGKSDAHQMVVCHIPVIWDIFTML